MLASSVLCYFRGLFSFMQRVAQMSSYNLELLHSASVICSMLVLEKHGTASGQVTVAKMCTAATSTPEAEQCVGLDTEA